MLPAAKRAPGSPRVTGMAAMLLDYAKHAMRMLGTGHSERVYHRALATSLGRTPIQFRSEVVTPIMYMGECVGTGRADLVLQGRQKGPRDTARDLAVEIKANARPPSQASGQLRKYMESLRRVEKRECAGVVLNFNQSTGEVDLYVEDKAEARPQRPAPVKRSRFFAGAGAGSGAQRERLEKMLATARAAVTRLEREVKRARRQ
jgi:GxxExxY protein